MIAGGELVGELVVQSAEVEVIGADPGEAAVLVVQREVLGVAGVADLGLFQAPGGEAGSLISFEVSSAPSNICGIRPLLGCTDGSFGISVPTFSSLCETRP